MNKEQEGSLRRSFGNDRITTVHISAVGLRDSAVIDRTGDANSVHLFSDTGLVFARARRY